MKILLTGGSGLLGKSVRDCLAASFHHELIAPTHKQMDITDEDAVRQFLTAVSPDAVLHCAAYSKVDQAESAEALCRRVNVDGTRNLTQICSELGCYLVYISSDYVFNGQKSGCYETNDPCDPLSVYGKSKADAESIVLSQSDANCVIRTSWLFGPGQNFVDTMLRLSRSYDMLRVVCDQIGSPTFSEDLAPLLVSLCENKIPGILHATNEGVCSWAEYAAEIFRMHGSTCCVAPIPTSDYPTAAVRPLNSRLSKRSLDRAGLTRLPPWQDALHRYLETNK